MRAGDVRPPRNRREPTAETRPGARAAVAGSATRGADRPPARPSGWPASSAVLAAAVLVVAAATRPDGRAHVVVLDVGQGDAILVTGPTGGRMLVDGGPDPDRLLVALDARVPPWDRRIDLVVLDPPPRGPRRRACRSSSSATASDGSWSPGCPAAAPATRRWRRILAARGTAPARLVTGDRFALDGIAFDVLWPDADRVPAEASDDGSEVNDASIVLLGSFEGRRFLLTGDAEADVEDDLVARGLPAVDLLKAGHHGSRTSTTDALVDGDSAAGGGRLGRQPGTTTATRRARCSTRLAAAGAIVLRTDEVGTIDVALDAARRRGPRTERPGRGRTAPERRRGGAARGRRRCAGAPRSPV